MKTTVDRTGRLVIPKEIRREAKLASGAPLEVVWREERIEIEPAPAGVRLQSCLFGGFLRAVGGGCGNNRGTSLFAVMLIAFRAPELPGRC